MRDTLLVLALLAAAAPGATAPLHHQRPPETVFRLQPLRGSVHALFGRGGNVGFFVGSDAVVVVDSQFKDLAPGIVEQIRSTTDKPIKYLINTHHHGDHVGGNDTFRPIAVIVAHDNVRKRMLANPANVLREYPALLEAAKKEGNEERAKRIAEQIEWAQKVKVEEIPAPAVTYASEARVHVGGETIHLIHVPSAHTDGDTAVIFEKANVAHLGDLFFHKVVPFIDVSSGGSVRGYQAVLDRLADRLPADAVIIPGHGEISDQKGLQTLRQYVTDLLALAKAARAAGKTKEQFVEEAALPAYKDWQGYDNRFKANAAAAWEEAQ